MDVIRPMTVDYHGSVTRLCGDLSVAEACLDTLCEWARFAAVGSVRRLTLVAANQALRPSANVMSILRCFMGATDQGDQLN